MIHTARAGKLQADEGHSGAADRQRRAGAASRGARSSQATHAVEPKGGLKRRATHLTLTAMSITIDELQEQIKKAKEAPTIPAWVGLLLSKRQASKRAEDAQAACPTLETTVLPEETKEYAPPRVAPIAAARTSKSSASPRSRSGT